MFKDNLISLRKMKKLSQEELAYKIGVSRQTMSKWETGESLPDIGNCIALADIFGVSLDDLVSYDKNSNMGLPIPPKGKHLFGIVKVGEKGQIVLPAKARKVFDISSGDRLVVLGDEITGIALIKEKNIMSMLNEIRNMEN
ncbi:MAG: helix-turn-helix transcriptional regulator [Oscillospiraceae bacterium]|nr:helix-turn-helix transcriptional regulator [Oscillospiraceae bacterium]